MFKKAILFFLTFVIFFVPFFIFAAENNNKESAAVINIPGGGVVTQSDIKNEEFLAIKKYLAGFFKFGIGIAGILAVSVVFWGAILLLTSGGNASQIEKAKSYIGGAIFGLVLALASYIILETINPNIVNLITYGKINILKKENLYLPACSWQKKECEEVSDMQEGEPDKCGDLPEEATAGEEYFCCCKKFDISAVCGKTQCVVSSLCLNNMRAYRSMVEEEARSHNFPTRLIEGIICRESGGRARARGINYNDDGTIHSYDCGIMQINTKNANRCEYLKTHVRENIEIGVNLYRNKVNAAMNEIFKYNYPSVFTPWMMGLARYNCCKDGTSPNAPSRNCTEANGYGPTPKWACSINPGGIAVVKNYVCNIYACAEGYTGPIISYNFPNFNFWK